jgi:predicted TIM-barrel fold metal-dependent hydrolase
MSWQFDSAECSVIDAYMHCGVSKYRPIGDVLDVMRHSDVQRSVLVQHMGEYDNSYLAKAVEEHSGVFAAVALVDPGGDWLRTINDLAEGGRFRGLRVDSAMVTAAPALCTTALQLKLNLVVYLDNPTPALISALRCLVDRDLPGGIVLSHFGGIVREGNRAALRPAGLELASYPRVFVTLSGQSMFCSYPYGELDAGVEALILAFGTDRVMWGSNYPVCGDAEAYRRDLGLIRPGAWGLKLEQVEQVVHKTAELVWFQA